MRSLQSLATARIQVAKALARQHMPLNQGGPLQPCGHGLGLMAEDVSSVSEVSVFPIRHLCLLFVGMRGVGGVCRFGGGGGAMPRGAHSRAKYSWLRDPEQSQSPTHAASSRNFATQSPLNWRRW